MSGGLYGVDDISPIVIDPGSRSIRAGYGGQEQPFFDIPSHVGVREIIQSTTDETVDSSTDPNARPQKEYFLDTTKVFVPRENTEIVNFMKGGLIEDWDIFEELWDYINNKCLICDTKEHPLLMSESAWNTREKRERIVEIAFEKYKMPACYLMKNAVLTLFSSGRSSGLVLDCGATHTSAIPVHDGYCLAQNVVTQPIGGDTILEQCRINLEKQGIEIVPPYKIGKKEEVGEEEKSVWTPRPNLPVVTKSFEEFSVKQILEDFAQSTLQLSETPADVDFIEKLPAQSYCFPCGYKKDFHSERAKIPEALFDLKYLKGETKHLMNVSDIAATSCGMCEPEIRQQMYSNVYVAGGGSNIMGFIERVNHDLALRCGPSVKIRVNGAPTILERRFGAWIGGSIISCMPQFYNYWVSKAEYEECGKSLVEKRCHAHLSPHSKEGRKKKRKGGESRVGVSAEPGYSMETSGRVGRSYFGNHDEGAMKDEGGLRPANPVVDKAMGDFVSQTMKTGLAGLKNEWITVAGTFPTNTTSTLYDYNQQRNFPGGCPCLDSTRVPLFLEVPPLTEYIHANYVTTNLVQMQKLILTQAPIDFTVNDFWRMIYQEKCHAIVMLCDKYENGRRIVAQYWPLRIGECSMYGQIRVQNNAIVTPDGELSYVKYQLTVSYKSEPVLTTILYIFKGWKDGTVPDSTFSLLRCLRSVACEPGPLVIHGAAGAGRPGTFAAIMIGMRALMIGKPINIQQIVLEIREMRCSSVATEIQYIFIYRALCEYIQRKGILTEQINQIVGEFEQYKKEFNELHPTKTVKPKSPGGA